jgi:hypothetical protein
MRLNHVKVKAKEITDDCLIYLPKEKRFFWVDFVDMDEDGNVVFIFEEGISRSGIKEVRLVYKPNQVVINVTNDLMLSLYLNEGHKIIENYSL